MPEKSRSLGWYQKEDGTWVVAIGSLRKWLRDGEDEFRKRFGESTRSKHHLSRIVLGLPTPRPTKGSLDGYEALPEAVELILAKSRRLPRALAELEAAKAAIDETPSEALDEPVAPVPPDLEEAFERIFRKVEPPPHAGARDLRRWQGVGFPKVMAEIDRGARSALVNVVPAGGKTYFAMYIYMAVRLKLETRPPPLIIVTPSDAVKNRWITEAAEFGLNIKSVATDPRDFERGQSDIFVHGYAINYSHVPGVEQSLSDYCRWLRPFVILDEIHHTASKYLGNDGNIWGSSVEAATEGCLFVLPLTGTAFRTGKVPISYLDYDQTGVVKSIVTYTYKEAVEDLVCRPMEFRVWGATFIMKDPDLPDGSALIDLNTELIVQRSRERLRAAVTDKRKFLPQVLVAAHQQLMKVREQPGRENAAGMVIAADTTQAQHIATVLKQICGEDAVVVSYEEHGNQGKIDRFRDSTGLWIIGIKMLSEGVDIPRLSVGVYLTTIATELFFKQVCGRLTRRTLGPEVGKDGEFAYLFIPGDPRLIAFAKRMAEEAALALDLDPWQGAVPGDRSGLPRGVSEISIEVVEAEEEAKILDGNMIPMRYMNKYKDRIEAMMKKSLPTSVSMSKATFAVIMVNVGLLPRFDEDDYEEGAGRGGIS